MGEVLQRRFYTVLWRATYALIAWLVLLMIALAYEEGEKHFLRHPERSYTFFVMTLPLYAIVIFGCYSLIIIGYHMIVLCKYTSHSFSIYFKSCMYDLLLNYSLFFQSSSYLSVFVADCKDA